MKATSLPPRMAKGDTPKVAMRASVPSLRSWISTPASGITTKNMPKISQAGTLCWTAVILRPDSISYR